MSHGSGRRGTNEVSAPIKCHMVEVVGGCNEVSAPLKCHMVAVVGGCNMLTLYDPNVDAACIGRD